MGGAVAAPAVSGAEPTESSRPPASPARIRWAVLLARIYEVLPLLCPACGGQMRIPAFLTDPPVVSAILLHLELPRGTYWATGAEGNETMIVPSHGLVIAKNAWSPTKSVEELVARIVEPVVKTPSDCTSSGWHDYGFDDETQCRSYVAHRGELK